MATTETRLFVWGNNPRRAELFGRECIILETGRLCSALVRFSDTGERVICSRRALRKPAAAVRVLPARRPIALRLADLTRVDEDGCWRFTGEKKRGYGYIFYDKKVRRVHRLAYELHHGGRVPPGLVVMHLCDVKDCVNPAHLRLGTQTENIADMRRKGRAKAPPPGGSDGWRQRKRAGEHPMSERRHSE